MIKSVLDPTLPFASGGKQLQSLEADFTPAFEAWKRNDSPQTRSTLLRQSQPIIDRAVYTYAGKGASPAVKTQAKLLALDAFKSYDPNKGSMKNHLMSQLRRIQRQAAQSQQIISIPERISLDRRHLIEAEENLRDHLGRDPSDAEIADHTGLSLKRIGHIRSAQQAVNTGSILDPEGEVYSPASMLPGDNSVEDAWTDMIYYDLGNVDQAIMDYSLGLHGAPILENREIAAKLGMSPGAISQRKAKIQQMLDERFSVEPFGGE